MNLTTHYRVIDCCGCGFLFAVPSAVDNRWRDSHEFFYCPSCKQTQHYTGKSDTEKLQARLTQEKAAHVATAECRDRCEIRADHEAKRAAGYKGAMRKAQKAVEKEADDE